MAHTSTNALPIQTDHKTRVIRELREAQVSRLGFIRFDMGYIPTVIQHNEHIQALVYGLNQGNSMSLIATDHRIILLDKKPLFVNQDDISYQVVSGVSFSHAGIGSMVTLHTRIKDITIRTLNQKAARRFVRFIESHCMKANPGAGYYD